MISVRKQVSFSAPETTLISVTDNIRPFHEKHLPACAAKGLYPNAPYYSKLSIHQWLLLQNLTEESTMSEK